MSLVSTSIANLINGVSQQPNALRLASQCELQENCTSSVVDGLKGRNGTRHSKKIMETPLGNAFSHMINRDAGERYRVIITGGAIKVYDLAGNQQTVNVASGAAAYLASATPADDFSALTVADYTFILNKKTTVQQDTTVTPTGWTKEALVWIRTASPTTRYSITVDGFTATRLTGSASTAPESVATDTIAAVLASTNSTTDAIGLASRSNASSYVVTNVGSLVYIRKVDGSDFTISVSDGVGDTGIMLIKGVTQRFTNLPARGYPGFRTQVQGEGAAFNTSYWVEFTSDPTNQFGGVWKECAKPGEPNALMASTMPHVLIRNADGTFTFTRADWKTRLVGDIEKTNPMPSFVGRKINDIFFHRNRLGFLSDENMVMSVAGEFFDFFKGSAVQVLDTDPIDVAVSNTKVSVLNHAVPWHESLLLFSDQSQFMLGKTTDILTVRTASVDLTTEFECSKAVKPISVGKYVYFVHNRTDYSAVREFAVDAYTLNKDAQDVTAHVPKYIPAGVFKLTAANTENIMVALTHNEPGAVYVYQYFVAGEQKLQSAWHKWTFGDNVSVLNADFIESDLHLLVNRPDGVYLEVMTVTPSLTDGNEPFSVHLDRMADETKVTLRSYNAGTNTTTFELPYAPENDDDYVLIAWEGNADFKVGRKVKYSRSGPSIAVLGGDLQHFRFGRRIKSRYVFSTLMIREQSSGGGQTTIAEGRINVRRMTLTYGKSGFFKVNVTPRGRDTYTTVMSGRIIGNSSSLLGSPSIVEGILRVPIMARNTDVTIEVESDEFLPFSILSADWEGMFVIRSRRI